MRSRGNNQEDYLLRLIEEAAAAIRMLKHKLAGTTDSPESVREQAALAIGMLLGERSTMLSRLDPMSAAHLVGHAEHVALWTALLDVESSAAERCGDVPFARSLRDRAAALRAASHVLWGPGAGNSEQGAGNWKPG